MELRYLVLRDEKYVINRLKQERHPFILFELIDSLFSTLSFYRPMTKEQFFEDRPWLQENEKVYEDFIKDRLETRNARLYERQLEIMDNLYEDRLLKFYEKKNN